MIQLNLNALLLSAHKLVDIMEHLAAKEPDIIYRELTEDLIRTKRSEY